MTEHMPEHLREEHVAWVAEMQAADPSLCTGAVLLDDVQDHLRRLVAFPDSHALIAVTLWVAHAHCIDYFESSPRLALLSPEPASGKTRALEVTETLVPNPMAAINATPAALFRAVSDLEFRPTVLFDEIDAVFGPKAKEHEELRGLLNAGHRRTGSAYRCVGEGTRQRVVKFPAYAALALAGLGDLPDTLMSRSVVIRMRRRGPAEKIEPFRQRIHEPQGFALRDRLAAWTGNVKDQLLGVWPNLPGELVDRPADVWEPLIAIADAAGGRWPDAARTAAVAMSTMVATDVSLGVRLLVDMAAVFEGADAMHTETILGRLHGIDDAPWDDLKGKPLDARGLAWRLRQYQVTSTNVKLDGETKKGYRREDLWDPWQRYVPDFPSSLSPGSATSATSATQGTFPQVNDLSADHAPENPSATSATEGNPLTWADNAGSGGSASQPEGDGEVCAECGTSPVGKRWAACDTCAGAKALSALTQPKGHPR